MRIGIFATILLCLSAAAHAGESLGYNEELWTIHGQGTVVTQWHPAFPAPYSGPNSFLPIPEYATSVTATLYLGRKLWKGASVYLDPEITAGTGFSGTHGMAAFPNGEIFRVDSPDPKVNLSRFYLAQVFGWGEETELFENDKNQLAANLPVSRVTLIAGKITLNDFFDNNTYAHDPRTQFLNWGFMDLLSWDYAADTRGYTYAFYAELNQKWWALRGALATVTTVANGLDFDWNFFQASAANFELEGRAKFGGHPGRARLLGYWNHADMGNYARAAALGVDIVATRTYSAKWGLGLNLEQEILPELGVFGRFGFNDGHTENWMFSEADETGSVGASLSGAFWSRPKDRIGLAYLMDGPSADHAAYLAGGGTEFLLGDGHLNSGPEQVIEVYYMASFRDILQLSLDFQEIFNPGFNRDRGPVSVVSGRVHAEF